RHHAGGAGAPQRTGRAAARVPRPAARAPVGRRAEDASRPPPPRPRAARRPGQPRTLSAGQEPPMPLASEATDAWLHALKHLSVEELLLPILVQLTVIIVAARLLAGLFRRLGQPSVVGEIAAGLVLGPSVLGRLFPDAWKAVFHPGVAGVPAELGDPLLGTVLTALSQLGLVFLLFLVGLECDCGHLRWRGRSAAMISAAGSALPFALRAGLAW